MNNINKKDKMFGKKINIIDVLEEVDSLKDKICDVKEVLEFYSLIENYKNGDNWNITKIDFDEGQLAREILNKIKN